MTITHTDPEVYLLYDQQELDNLSQKQLKKLFTRISVEAWKLVYQKLIDPKKIEVFLPPTLKQYYQGIYKFSLTNNNFVALISKN